MVLVSAVLCQCNMVTMMAATSASHCTSAEEGDAPVAQCCFTPGLPIESIELSAPTPNIDAAVLWAETAVGSQIVPYLYSEETLQMPPRSESLSHQICVLLI